MRRPPLTMSGRFELPWLPGLTGGAVARMTSGSPFTVHNSNVDANRNNIAVDPIPAGTHSGVGENAITVDLYAEFFNITNEPNFSNPTGDQRLGTFLVPTSLAGGGFLRQFQIGMRVGF